MGIPILFLALTLIATENYYSKEELAQVIIPAISVITIDQDK